MGTQHTPGPWKWDESWGAIVVDRPDMQRLICPMWTGCDRARMGRDVVDEDLANARLIAAAPDLLEACKIAEGAFGACISEQPAKRVAQVGCCPASRRDRQGGRDGRGM